MTALAPTVEQVRWDAARTRMDWRQGEHITLVGPTGRGKTELEISLLASHPWVVFLGTKRIDPTQDKLRAAGYRIISDPAELNPELATRFVFRPRFPKTTASELKRAHTLVFRELLMRAYRQTGWTIAADELRYIAHFLGLTDELMLLWLQGRSQGSTVIGGTQRPRFIPLEAYDQATHLFFWRDKDRANVDRVAEIAGIDRRTATAIVPNLPLHNVLYVNTATDDMFVTNTRW